MQPTPAGPHLPRLRDLPFLVRLGLTGLVLTLGLGMGASVLHLVWHYDNRDERAGFTVDDVRAAYHGLDSPAPLARALRNNHPPELPEAARATLLKWLDSGKVREGYDDLNLGENSPSELIAKNCLDCHGRKGSKVDAAALKVPLDYMDDAMKVAFGRKVDPAPTKIVALSTHTHAPAMATMSLVLCGMLVLTRLPRLVVGGVTALVGLGLLADIASWWLARPHEGFVYVIVCAGGVYNGASAVGVVLVVVDLWWPRRKGA